MMDKLDMERLIWVLSRTHERACKGVAIACGHECGSDCIVIDYCKKNDGYFNNFLIDMAKKLKETFGFEED